MLFNILLGDTELMYDIKKNNKIKIFNRFQKKKYTDLNLVNKNGNTALTLAINNNIPDVAMEIINLSNSGQDCNISHIDSGSDTALLLALHRYDNMEDVAIELIKTGKLTTINHINAHGDNALLLAIDKGLHKIALEILKIYNNNIDVTSINAHGDDPLTLAINRYIVYNDLGEVAYEIVKTGRANLNYIDNHGNTALSLALRYGLKNIVYQMLSYDDNDLPDIMHIDNHSDSTLLIAIDNLMDDIALLLIEKCPNVICHINEHGFTALILAITKGLKNVASKILETSLKYNIKNHISNIDCNGDTALIYAITHNNNNNEIELAMTIYNSGKGLPKHINKHGNTAFIYAITNNNLELAIRMIKNGDVDNSIITNDSNTSLFLALEAGMYDLAELIIDDLIKTNPKILGHVNNEGDVCIILCITYGREDLALKILKSDNSNYEILSKQNDTTLQLAINNNMLNLAKEIILLKNEKVINHINNNDDTALILCVAKRFEDLAILLINTKICYIDIPNIYGDTPLILAQYNKLNKVIKSIKEKMYINYVVLSKKK